MCIKYLESCLAHNNCSVNNICCFCYAGILLRKEELKARDHTLKKKNVKEREKAIEKEIGKHC